jgi:hypothetical protein
VAVWLSTIGPSERLSTRQNCLGQFLLLLYLAPIWAESKLTRPLIAIRSRSAGGFRQHSSSPVRASSARFFLAAVFQAKPPVSTGTFLQRVSQLQKGRMPCGQSVIAQFGIDAVVAVAVNKTACDSCDPGIGVNVAQGIQCPLAVVGRKGAAVIALFPKMPGPL